MDAIPVHTVVTQGHRIDGAEKESGVVSGPGQVPSGVLYAGGIHFTRFQVFDHNGKLPSTHGIVGK
jgi:hypothetical protein